jgi:hypothetical protein
MTKIFDWSSLDRNLLVSVIKTAAPTIVGSAVSPVDVSKHLKQTFKFFDIPINIKTIYNKVTKQDTIWIGGTYESDLDEESKNPITIITQFNQKGETVTLNKHTFNRLCYSIADTVLHEIIHTRQYRRRNHKEIPGYYSTASSGKKNTEQTYLGHPDEIDAYSFNIACQLIDRFHNDDKSIIKYLNTDLSDKRLKKDTYKMYLQTFDHNHKHTVIRRLKKKIVYYLSNARQIGKPYKTNDWLKK